VGHERFAERAEARLEEMVDRLEKDVRELGIDGVSSGTRARELRVAAFVVRVEAASREERRSTRSTAAIAENPPLEVQG